MNVQHFRQYIVRPILQAVDLWSDSAGNLLIGTALVESNLEYLRQIGGGPAMGLYQCEPATHRDIWDNYIAYKPGLEMKVKGLMLPWLSQDKPPEQLMWNPAYATVIARVHYLRVPVKLPDADDLRGLGEYWKRYYNTHLGAGRVSEFVKRLEPHI